MSLRYKRYDGATIRKIGTNDDPNVRQFTISSGAVDSYNSTLNPKGWDLGQFRKNGPFLWAHDSRMPAIGVCVGGRSGVWTEDSKLKAQFRFVDSTHNHPMGVGFGHSIMRLYDEGFIKGCSVGFKPLDQKESDREPDPNGCCEGMFPVDYTKQRLVEVSGCNLPSNPEALIEAKTRGIEVVPIFNWCEHVRDGSEDSPVLTREQAGLYLDAYRSKVVAVPESLEREESPQDIQPHEIAAAYADSIREVVDAETRLVAMIGDLTDQLIMGGKLLVSENAGRLANTVSDLGEWLVGESEEDTENNEQTRCESCSCKPEETESEVPENQEAQYVTQDEVRAVLADSINAALSGLVKYR